MSPWDVLGWMLVVGAGLFLALMAFTTVVMVVRIWRDANE